jgi:hypothetical protein
MRKGSGKSGKPRSRVAPLVRGVLNTKAKGNLGELAFVHKAASLGFGVAKPHGDNERYDFIVDSGERLWRVQVKTTYKLYRGAYRTMSCRNHRKRYRVEEIDFLVAYIVPRNVWYVIPVDCLGRGYDLAFYPSGCRQGGHFECYREAWHLMAARACSASVGRE